MTHHVPPGYISLNFKRKGLGTVAHTCVIPALWEATPGGSLEVRSLRPAWSTWQNPVSTKNIKISQHGGTYL